MGKQLYILYEDASGFGLFEVVENEEIGSSAADVQKSITDLTRFSKMMKLKSFLPFKSAENALDNINHISEGEVTPYLGDWLEMNLPKTKPGKKAKHSLGVIDHKIGNVIQESLGINCESNDTVLELIRGIRLHFTRFLKALSEEDHTQAILGLSHSYSRAKVKFNVNKADNMIIHSIALLDQFDKDLNTFAMRVREWYSWHFPELAKIVNDNYQFCRLASFIKHKEELSEDSLAGLEEITMDGTKAKEILDAARMSMGTNISEIDLINIDRFSKRVIKLSEYRKQLHNYLMSKMNTCAPNLTALIGEQVGARLISHAGSLTNLAKYPASTVQILGAEKALFRALKTKGNTPKYGLIFNSTFIGRAAPKNKGRISRFLANKCSMASRIDAFSEEPTDQFGHKLREQVEERLEFYKTGVAPRKNIDVMHGVIEDLGGDITAKADGSGASSSNAMDTETPSKKKSKKNKRKAEDDLEDVAAATETPKKDKKKKDKKKKDKKKKAKTSE